MLPGVVKPSAAELNGSSKQVPDARKEAVHMSTVLARHDLKRALVAVRRDESSQAVACGRGENSRPLQNRRAARSLPVMTLAALRAAVIYLYTQSCCLLDVWEHTSERGARHVNVRDPAPCDILVSWESRNPTVACQTGRKTPPQQINRSSLRHIGLLNSRSPHIHVLNGEQVSAATRETHALAQPPDQDTRLAHGEI
jgi:hypothetical protein